MVMSTRLLLLEKRSNKLEFGDKTRMNLSDILDLEASVLACGLGTYAPMSKEMRVHICFLALSTEEALVKHSPAEQSVPRV